MFGPGSQEGWRECARHVKLNPGAFSTWTGHCPGIWLDRHSPVESRMFSPLASPASISLLVSSNFLSGSEVTSWQRWPFWTATFTLPVPLRQQDPVPSYGPELQEEQGHLCPSHLCVQAQYQPGQRTRAKLHTWLIYKLNWCLDI